MLAEMNCRWISEEFWHRRKYGIAGILCVIQYSILHEWGKRPAEPRQGISRVYQLKKGAGRMFHSPRCSSRFACARYFPLLISPTGRHLGGQNLAALSTTAGQNLTAVGSSHSLAETVNLGTVTLGGLIGTLHYTFTSCG